MPSHRILFLGQKLFGEAAWERLMRCRSLEVMAISTNVRSDNVWWQSNEIYQTRGDIPLIDNSVRSTEMLQRVIEQYKINFILCVQHPWILPPIILSSVNYQAINFHNAKLPDYRGYNAVNHAIMNGDEEFICTAHWMSDKVDRGGIALEGKFKIAPNETAISLYAKCHHAGLALFDEVIRRLSKDIPIPRHSVVGKGQFYGRDSVETLREIMNITAGELDVKGRAFYFPPFEPAYVRTTALKVYVIPESPLDNIDYPMSASETLGRYIRAVEDQFSCEIQ